MQNFFIDMGIAVLLRLLSERKIPKSYVSALLKLRNALNMAFPPIITDGEITSDKPAANITLV